MKKISSTKTQMIRACSLIITILFISTAATPQQKPVANKYPATLLWRISGNGLVKPSYLYGTMHLTDKRLFYFGDSLYKAIEQVEGFAIEINPDELSTQLINSFSKEDNSGYLKYAVDKERYERIKKKLEKKYGFKTDQLTRRQAYLSRNEWMKDLKKPDDVYTFMDAWLYNIARQLGKWTGGIEDLEDQLRLIENEEANFSFEELLINKKEMQGGLNQMIEMYLSQDLQAIYDFFNTNAQNKKDEWLTKRNIKMAHRMDSLLRFRTHFFAIGAAHLPGDSGVIKLLLKKGFSVDPVFSSRRISPDEYKVAAAEMKWHPFVPVDSLYYVSFPSKSATLFLSGNSIKMEMCIDIPTATYYITAAVPNMRQDENKEKLIAEMLEGFTKEGKILEKKKINHDGETGLELFVEKDGYLRVKGFVKGNYAFICVMGHETKKEMITGSLANGFFSSFKVSEKALLETQQMKTFSSEEDGFSILMPQKPEEPKIEKDTEGWVSKTYSAIDVKNNVYFMVMVRSTAPGFYINGDSNYFSLQKRNWAHLLKKVTAEEYYMMGNFPAMRYDFFMERGKEKAISKTITINRGNRSYLLLAVTEKEADSNPAIAVFFNSFQLLDYKKADWKMNQSHDGYFSAYTPASILIKKKKDTDGKEDGTFTYVSYDSLTAVSYEFTKISYEDYYHATTDSAAFYDAMHTQVETSDSVISSQYVRNGKDKAQDVILQLKNNQNFRRMRMVLHGDTMYIASAFLHPGLLHSAEINKCFDEFVVLTPSTATTLFNKKTKDLLVDLASGDSSKFASAAERIAKITFEKEDLPLLKEALLKQYDLAEESHEDIYNTIVDIIAEMNDPSIVSFIEKKYFSPNLDNEAQKLAMLRLLALTQTKESYTVLKNLLLTEPPYIDYLYPLQSALFDSLQFTKTLFPEVMRLCNDSLFADFIALLANRLLDSNFISLAVIKPFEENLLKLGEQLIEKLKADPDAYVWREDECMHLLGRLNSPAGNAFLQRLIAFKQKELNRIIIVDLLLNSQPVPKEIINVLAADKEYRFSFYDRLQKNGFASVFPSKYSTQKSLAESDVFAMASNEYTIEGIAYIDDKVINYKGDQKRFFLYKVKVEEDGWYLGISGGYNKDMKILHIEKGKDVGGIYWNEAYDAKKINEQFEAYLKEYLQ